jgi:hypothetical protein
VLAAVEQANSAIARLTMPSRKRGWIVAALFGFPVAMIAGCWATEELEVRAFYDKHKLVHAMRESTKDFVSGQMDVANRRREVLLASIPLGRSHPEVIQKLAQEGFECTPKRWDLSWRNYIVGCFLRNQPQQVGRWYVDLHFDGDEKLTSAGASILKS